MRSVMFIAGPLLLAGMAGGSPVTAVMPGPGPAKTALTATP